ncbi:phosphoethanolamine transferase [Mariniflexile sp. HNIBRBA6329]|uniref:phosphoethanolamine transferase n=1 Tax=Mariniflexile sp. HNIBRBA6329 TaxID=3373088 RepID=UPI0037477126
MFKTNLNSSAIFVSLDSNLEEAKEFIGFYLDIPIVLFTILNFIITLIVLFNTKKLITKALVLKKQAIILFVLVLAFLKFSNLIIYNLPYLVIKSSIEYRVESSKLGDYRKNKNGNFKNVSRNSNEEEQEVYVIVIGESTSKSHMGLYGYYRETTPLLNEIKDELQIYDNVITPHTYTIASLTKALTLSNYENPKSKYKGSIIQLLNQAKFKTYWISNQKPIGVFDSQVTKIGLGAQESVFLNLKHTDEKTTFDDILLDGLKSVLVEKNKKKVIFLHMLGAHMDYKKRYPDTFNYFKNKPITEFKDDKSYEAINSYDNAIRYSDFILRDVIENTKALNIKSCVLYFSDHGEEVYNDIYFKGHSVDQVVTRNIYEIPMFLWISDNYKQERTIVPNYNSKYMIDDLFHSIADLIGVKALEVDSSRSIFNQYFKERKRIIKGTIDYDTYFK